MVGDADEDDAADRQLRRAVSLPALAGERTRNEAPATVADNVHVEADAGRDLGENPARVLDRVGDVVIDKVFGDAPNDLVVPTRGVSETNGASAFPLAAASCFVFPATRGVMHTHYFEASETAERLLAWLPSVKRDAPRATARPAAAARPRPASPEHQTRR